MRADQVERLAALSEKLADVVLEETDPDTWPGAGSPSSAWDKQVRGDRYWMKKNAAASLMLLAKVEQLQDQQRQAAPPLAPVDDEPNMDTLIASAEREAAKLIDQTMQAARKEAFDAHVHGKKH